MNKKNIKMKRAITLAMKSTGVELSASEECVEFTHF
jgi:hypothetical protein